MKKTQNTSDNKKRLDLLRRTASEVRSYRVQLRILTVLLVMLILITGILYLTSVLYEKSGSFTVSIDKYEMTKYGLTLSETSDMTHQSSSLNAKSAEKITNIAGETISPNVDNIDGEHNGRNYIAYTFYVQNAGEVEISYDYTVKISGITNALDEAIRIRLYVDGGEPVTYAKTKSDGSGAEPGPVEFHSANVAARGRIESFEPLEKTKFTVVIWIEGNDPDCIDWLIGGKMKIEMDIGVVH